MTIGRRILSAIVLAQGALLAAGSSGASPAADSEWKRTEVHRKAIGDAAMELMGFAWMISGHAWYCTSLGYSTPALTKALTDWADRNERAFNSIEAAINWSGSQTLEGLRRSRNVIYGYIKHSMEERPKQDRADACLGVEISIISREHDLERLPETAPTLRRLYAVGF